MASSQEHHTFGLSFSARAAVPSCPPLNAYLLHLMTIKRTNLCLSADVTTSSELLSLAEELGDSICLLKTHADIISDWSDRTVRHLRDIATRKHFLIFEDRKFADIGSTVQKQYVAGPLSIAKWAELVTVHVLPGPAIVTALKQASISAISSYNTTVHTEITSGDGASEDEEEQGSPTVASSPRPLFARHRSRGSQGSQQTDDGERLYPSPHGHRKQSIVSISTTISTRSEPMSPQPTKSFFNSVSSTVQDAYSQLGPIPYLRSCLLLAQMSSEDNLLTQAYTEKCVEIGRNNSDFVLGFIAQKSLNTSISDNFLTLTPGVQLNDNKPVNGDGLGQQYRTPRDVVLKDGTDIIIVGRGIIAQRDRVAVAERYRNEAWSAYEARIGAPP